MGLVLGPGLLVNVLLKGFWGRARPVQVIDFGGDHPFSAPWVIAGNCDWNCSFVSGEASSSMFLVALALVGPRAWRTAVATAAVVFSIVMSLNRIAFGGHFFSDVVLAWALTLLVILIAHRIVYAPSSPFTDERIAGALGAAGDRTRRILVGFAGRAADRVRRLAGRFR
nr:phosphatase PAP2 family protein [Chthonobacter albigriseus]